MQVKINAADAVEDPAIREVIKHLHVAIAHSKEARPDKLLSALSNMIGMIAIYYHIDFEILVKALHLDYLNQGAHLVDRFESLRSQQPPAGEPEPT